MTQYIYEGGISEQAVNGVRTMMRKYPNAVEFSKLPPHEVLDHLPLHASVGEDCMGGEYTKTTRKFGIVWKNFDDKDAGVFLFFLNQLERDLILGICRDLIVNINPFRTVI